MNPIAVVIVNYNTRHHLRACLSTVLSEAPSEVIVVDNASSDGSVEMVRDDYPSVLVQANQRNVGYGAASNQGIASCKAAYVFLLNADTRLQPGALRALSSYLDLHPRAAIVGPRLVELDGSLQASCYPFPTPLHTFLENSSCAVILGRLVRRYVPAVRRLYLRTWPHNAARTVPWLKGAALFVRRNAFEAVGGFDKSFFLYFEDADLCYRLKAVGWEVHFAPVTTVMHAGGASTLQYRGDMAVQLLASTIHFYRRHCSTFRLAEMVVIVKSLMLANWICALFQLKLTRDPGKRSEIAQDISASHKVAFGRWPWHEWRVSSSGTAAPLTVSSPASETTYALPRSHDRSTD